ncbi:hypothetical protein Tco_1136961 [Tanacetum coccineum]
MKETKAYKTYLCYAIRVTPPKIARKFKKDSPSNKDIILNLVPADEEPKSAKKKVPAKKTTRKQSSRVFLRDTLKVSSSKKKGKMYVNQGKGIELLSEVALTEEAQFEEVHKRSMRDFHRTRPSGSGTAKIKPSITNEGTDYEHETDKKETGSEFDQHENEEEVEDDEEENEDEFIRTPSHSTTTDDEDETNVESKAEDNVEGDEDKGMDDTTNQFDDDVDVRLNDPIYADEGFVQKEGTDVAMTNKTEILVTSSSHSSDLASKFLNFVDIPLVDAKIVSPMDVHVHHEVPSTQTPTLLTVPISVITESSHVYTITIPESLPSFTPLPPLTTPTPQATTKVTNPLSALPDFASVF